MKETIDRRSFLSALALAACSGLVRPAQAAAKELSDWADELTESELRALRDPRNWVRPVVAVSAGGVATGALVLFELRRRGRSKSESGLRALGSGLRSRL